MALWGHLWYRPCRKGSGDGVQPHISQRHWQEVGNAQVFHGTPDRAAHRSPGEDKLLELHQHQSRDSLTCLVPPGLSVHPDWSQSQVDSCRSTPAVNKRPVISCDQISSTTPIKAKCQSNLLVWLQAVKAGTIGPGATKPLLIVGCLNCNSVMVLLLICVFVLWPQRFRTEFSEGKITGRVSSDAHHKKLLVFKS